MSRPLLFLIVAFWGTGMAAIYFALMRREWLGDGLALLAAAGTAPISFWLWRDPIRDSRGPTTFFAAVCGCYTHVGLFGAAYAAMAAARDGRSPFGEGYSALGHVVGLGLWSLPVLVPLAVASHFVFRGLQRGTA